MSSRLLRPFWLISVVLVITASLLPASSPVIASVADRSV